MCYTVNLHLFHAKNDVNGQYNTSKNNICYINILISFILQIKFAAKIIVWELN